jgi:hypothetical protein
VPKRNATGARLRASDCALCTHTEEHGWHGINGAAHCHTCHLTWTSRRAAHCPKCCAHFTSYSAADLHDRGCEVGCWPCAEVPGLTLAADGQSWRLARDPGASISAGRSARTPALTAAVAPGTGANEPPLRTARTR